MYAPEHWSDSCRTCRTGSYGPGRSRWLSVSPSLGVTVQKRNALTNHGARIQVRWTNLTGDWLTIFPLTRFWTPTPTNDFRCNFCRNDHFYANGCLRVGYVSEMHLENRFQSVDNLVVLRSSGQILPPAYLFIIIIDVRCFLGTEVNLLLWWSCRL